MESGVIVGWRKEKGDRVEKGDVLVEVESDKSTVEVESQYSGTLLKQYFDEGADIPCGDVIAVIGKEGDSYPERPPRLQVENIPSATSIAAVSQPGETSRQMETAKTQREKHIASPRARRYARERGIDLTMLPSGSGAGGRIEQRDVVSYEKLIKARSENKLSPVAQKLALESGIDVSSVKGSGPGGRILKEDVLRAIDSKRARKPEAEPISAESEEIPISRMRATIARRLSESKFTSPHYYEQLSVNMEQAIAARSKFNTENPERKVSWNSIFIKVVSIALGKHPHMNSSFRADSIILHRCHDIAVAVATENGLLTPVVRNCQLKPISEINYELVTLIEKAKCGALTPDEYENSTFTISNLGMYEIENFTAIINPPAAAILAIGKIAERPVVVEHEITIKPMLNLILSCDHRLIDGVVGAAFLKETKDTLETPLLSYF
jgi:pyruvate dehydrogenase E2 component (dihydrolipoamide acetyltransferase)